MIELGGIMLYFRNLYNIVVGVLWKLFVEMLIELIVGNIVSWKFWWE